MASPRPAPQDRFPEGDPGPPADEEPPSSPKRRRIQWLVKLGLTLAAAVASGIAKAVAEEFLRGWRE